MIDVSKYTANQHPGKFEGESSATEYFWNLVMVGDGEDIYPNMSDDCDDIEGLPVYTLFTVDAEEAEAWPSEFNIGDTVVVWESDQGFVTMCAYATRAAAEHFINKHALVL